MLREAQRKAHREANMDLLEILSCWLYTGELVFEEAIPIERTDSEEERLDWAEDGLQRPDQGNAKPDFNLILPGIVALYAFALKYEMPNLRKIIIRKLENDYPPGPGNLPSTECLVNAYKQMLPDYPPLMQLLVGYYVGYCDLDNENEMRDALDVPKGLLVEIAVELAQKAAWLRKKPTLAVEEVDDGWFGSLDPCNIHEHADLAEEIACRERRAEEYFGFEP